MAVTIGEVHVEVRDERMQAVAPEPASTPQQPRVDLASALERVRERRERLKAD